MTQFLIRRIFWAIFLFLVATIITYLIFWVIPSIFECTRTTSPNPHPASASAAPMLRRHCSACSTTSSEIVMVV